MISTLPDLHRLIIELNNIQSHTDNWWIEHNYEKINKKHMKICIIS